MQQKEVSKSIKDISNYNNTAPEDYLVLVKIWESLPEDLVITEFSQSFRNNIGLLTILNHSPCVTSILDLRTQQFDFVSSNAKEILGYASSHFMENGLAFCNEIAHPEDLPKTWKLLRYTWEFITNVSPADQVNFKFNHDYRIIKRDGKEIRILAQNSVLQSDSKGNITHVLCVYSDISRWKKSECLMASIVSTTSDSCFFITADDSGTYQPQINLSKRELEIVKLMAEGYSSKIIADKLFISFHTVNSHRQRIIEKTYAKNTGGVVQFAVSHGLI